MDALKQSQAKPIRAPSTGSRSLGLLQRKCACGGSPGLSGECEECAEKKLQRKALNSVADTRNSEPGARNGSSVPPIVHEVLNSTGQPLDAETRAFFESRFGHDFSQVRVHTDAKAAESARAVDALAYTTGRDVVFEIGQYAPETAVGKRLLAHELTHVVQQVEQLPDLNGPLVVGPAGGPLEREADSLAQSAAQDRISNSPLLERSLERPIRPLQRSRKRNHIMRKITEEGIRATPPEFSFSTNCGWIDWGHTIPDHARDVIGRVREASSRLTRKEATAKPSLRANRPRLLKETNCLASYEPGEVAESSTEVPRLAFTYNEGVAEYYLEGFGVDSADATKFGEFKSDLNLSKAKNTAIEISGFTDCTGSLRENKALRRERGNAVRRLFAGDKGLPVKIVDYEPDQFPASNATREGRRRNRGVLIRAFVPPPEQMRTRPMSSGGHKSVGGVQIGVELHKTTVIADISRSLTEEEVLSVALSIFMRQSFAFEAAQAATQQARESSFSEEDLPSNIISFYRAAKGYSVPEVIVICRAWDPLRSLQEFKVHRFQRNPFFRPPTLPPGGKWPAQFSTIQPASPALFDIIDIILEEPGQIPFHVPVP